MAELRRDLDRIQTSITNRLDPSAARHPWFAGVVGETPSQYSKSPVMWNTAFSLVGLDAIYLPFDVPTYRLKDLAAAFKDTEHLLGVNVTVPHKIEIMNHLDEVDSGAARIGAVNTIRRGRNGRLIGSNTDGEGFLESILTAQPGAGSTFLESLDGLTVILLGAGGSARAVAFHIGEQLGGGRLLICNRTPEIARSLAADLSRHGISCDVIGEEDLETCASRSDLIVNTTTKGQGGTQTAPDGRLFSMEPYSALAPAPSAPAEVSKSEIVDTPLPQDVLENQTASLAIASSIPQKVCFYDLIYFPEQTVFLRHAKMTGHRTQNGKGMIVCQAAIAFCKHLCAEQIRSRGLDERKAYSGVRAAMYGTW